MINVYVSYQELPRTGDAQKIKVMCNIDNLVCFTKNKTISGCAISAGLGSKDISRQLVKAYRESIRDYLYSIHGIFGVKQRIFERLLFRVSVSE